MDHGNWIPVSYELTETQYEGLLLELCTTLSADTRSAVVSISVQDSDELVLLLLEDGKLIDRYCSAPGDDIGIVELEHPRSHLSHASRWGSVLVPRTDPEQLAAIWGSEAVFTEDLLKQIAPLLGLTIGSCVVGYNYMAADEPDSAEPEPRVQAKLSFRRIDPVSPEPAGLLLLLHMLKERDSHDPRVRAGVQQVESQLRPI